MLLGPNQTANWELLKRILALILVPPFTDFSNEPDIAGGRRDMDAELAEVRHKSVQIDL